MATIKDIADKLGISVSTVSKGLNGANDISDSLRQLVLDTAVELGYTTKRMRKEGHRKLCVFIENIGYETPNHFGYDIVLGFKQAAYRDNWEITVLPIDADFQLNEKYDTYMLKNGYSGAFAIGFALSDQWMQQFATTTIPTVLLDNYIRKNPHVSYIATDSYEGIDSAIEHLALLGHSKIAFFSGSTNSFVYNQRRQAYIEALSAYGLSFQESLIAYSNHDSDNISNQLHNLLTQDVTAIVCSHDNLAYNVITECTRLGYHIPDDISVIGFDDLPLSATLTPPLTTIGQNRIELGKCGYHALESLINHVSISRAMLRAKLIMRASTASPTK